MPRHIELVLLHNGHAELIESDKGLQLWASDSDEDFIEEFPEFLDENDVEHVFDFLVSHEIIDEDEADHAEVSMEALSGETESGDELEGEIDDGEEEEGYTEEF